MDTNFINSTVGRKFLEYTMPELVHQFERLNRNLEKLITIADTITLEEEPIKSVGEMNKEIKQGIETIVNIRKDFNNDN